MTRLRGPYCQQKPTLAAQPELELELADVITVGEQAWAWRAVYEELAEIFESDEPRPDGPATLS